MYNINYFSPKIIKHGTKSKFIQDHILLTTFYKFMLFKRGFQFYISFVENFLLFLTISVSARKTYYNRIDKFNKSIEKNEKV